ncbi:MAG: hypothetical protein WBE22_11750 [Halobacteriota archaeon]
MEKEKYGANFQEHLLEQYKLYVEMADRISSRRIQANRFYVALLSGLLALLSLLVNRNVFGNVLNVCFMAVGILGIALCILWYVNIHSYRQLNSGKFQVIHEMELHLPFPAYKREWEILGKGKESEKYRKLTSVERYVAFIFSIPYFVLIIYSLYMLANCGN